MGRPTRRRRRTDCPVQQLRAHAAEVMKGLGKGHSKRVYHRAMITLLNSKLIPHRSEVIAPIQFMGEVVGFGRCDIIIGDLIIEFKANVKKCVHDNRHDREPGAGG